MRIRFAGVVALGVALAGCQMQQIHPTISRPAPAPSQTPQGATTYDWVAWEHWDCSVNWDQYCQMEETLAAPNGWQVCKPFYRVAGAGKGGPTFRATMNPDYVTVHYYFYVRGSGKWYDKWGSNLRVEDVGMKIISAPTTPAQRAAAGCIP